MYIEQNGGKINIIKKGKIKKKPGKVWSAKVKLLILGGEDERSKKER